MCWLAPLMATVMYSSGVMVLPVNPICHEGGTQPASTAARDAPMPAPSSPAMISRSLKGAGDP